MVMGGNIFSVPKTLVSQHDDYEVGSWTPVLAVPDGTGVAYSVQVGRYVKMGQVVHIQCTLTTSSLGGATSITGITGLPFTSENVTNLVAIFPGGNGSGLAITAGHSVYGLLNPNATQLLVRVWDGTGGSSGIAAAEWSDDGRLSFSGSYRAA